MSDMLEHGANGGAAPLPPGESHDEFLELCATATTGALSAEERRRLNAHLAQCGSCREIMAQYQAIVDRVIPAWAADPVEEKRVPYAWSQDEAEAQLFARLGESERFPTQRESGESRLPPESLAAQNARVSSGDALWRHMWVQFAAALLLVAALGLIAYRTGIRRGLDLAPRGSMPTPARPVSGVAIGPETPASDREPASATSGADQQLAKLRIQLEERLAEIERLKVQLTQTKADFNDKEADRIRLAQQRADLSQQLELASANLESVQQKLSSVTNQSSLDSARAATLEEKVNQLTASIGERDQEVANERELLDHDRDIRELMGSRDLYIAEVYDVAKTGDTQKPFGRGLIPAANRSSFMHTISINSRASNAQAHSRPGGAEDRIATTP